MSKKLNQLIHETITTTPLTSSSPCIGRLAGVNNQNDILVEYEGSGPKAARMIAALNKKDLAREEQRGREVLLVFDQGDLQRPIIIGLMENPLEDLVAFQLSAEEVKEVKDILIDGKQITIEAESEILLKCGKGSILIRKDGKIILKGTDLLSRSSGRQRIKGSSVSIN
jgi:hypothetical protein